MNILYIGDVMGEAGVEVVQKVLPNLRRDKSIDAVIAQSENVTDGKGLSVADYKRLASIGVDGFSGGNWTPYLPETNQLLIDPNVAVTGPANMPDCPGVGYKYLMGGRVLLISLLGKIVGRDADKALENPLKKIDEVLASQAATPRAATIVNFHGDYSSEKVVIGHYLDGRVSAVIGDHWHVPTADARILPGGTAHQTDVGMCGVLNASLGVSYESVIPRWRDNIQTKNILSADGPRQFNALLITVGSNGLAQAVEPIQKILG